MIDSFLARETTREDDLAAPMLLLSNKVGKLIVSQEQLIQAQQSDPSLTR